MGFCDQFQPQEVL